MNDKAFNLIDFLKLASEKWPTKIAVYDKGKSITFKELDTLSDCLSRFIMSKMQARNKCIGILMDKSIEAFISIWAILKSRAIFVPIDVNLPVERIRYIIKDADIMMLFVKGRFSNGDFSDNSICLFDWSTEGAENILNAAEYSKMQESDNRVIASDLAYIIYTSGSTGTPKGVMISHGNVISFILYDKSFFNVSVDDVILNTIPMHLDRFIMELFLHTCSGATDVILGNYLFVKDILNIIDHYKVTFLSTSPIILKLLCNDKSQINNYSLESLRIVLTGGESCAVKYVKLLKEKKLSRAVFINGYGPSETVVHVTYYKVDDINMVETENIPMGMPIPTTDILIVNDKGETVKKGEAGELLLRGENVMQGYLNLQSKTAEVIKEYGLPEQADYRRYYQTGDLVLQLCDGNLYYIGRKDNQIKSKGYRIELEEIEGNFNNLNDVSDCGVIAVDDMDIGKRIIIYLVMNKANENIVREDILKKLPVYMIPQEWHYIDRIPRNAFGKVDRKELKNMYANNN